MNTALRTPPDIPTPERKPPPQRCFRHEERPGANALAEEAPGATSAKTGARTRPALPPETPRFPKGPARAPWVPRKALSQSPPTATRQRPTNDQDDSGDATPQSENAHRTQRKARTIAATAGGSVADRLDWA